MKAKAPSQQVSAVNTTEAERLLSPVRAFVVQFRTGNGGPQQSFHGRVEHMTSGQVHRFSTPEELLAFFERVLAGVADEEG